MDHQAFAGLLGNYGEFIGEIAVVVTLFYLAIQVRHGREATEAHTRSMQEDQKLALAEAYRERAATRLQLHFEMAESDYIAPIEVKLEGAGWPTNVNALDQLEPVERLRYFHWTYGGLVRLDTSFYYHKLGLLDEEGWELTHLRMRQLAPAFKKLDMHRGISKGFANEMQSLVDEWEANVS